MSYNTLEQIRQAREDYRRTGDKRTPCVELGCNQMLRLCLDLQHDIPRTGYVIDGIPVREHADDEHLGVTADHQSAERFGESNLQEEKKR